MDIIRVYQFVQVLIQCKILGIKRNNNVKYKLAWQTIEVFTTKIKNIMNIIVQNQAKLILFF